MSVSHIIDTKKVYLQKEKKKVKDTKIIIAEFIIIFSFGNKFKIFISFKQKSSKKFLKEKKAKPVKYWA